MAKQIPYYNEETGENYAVDIDDTQRQSELTATGFTTDYKPDVLNSSALSATPSINYQTYQEPSVYNVAGLESAPLQMTPPEAEAQDFTSRLRGLQSQLLGESAIRTAEEEKQNIPALTQTQQDLTARLTTLKNEALAIPLLMQQQAQGRGITTEGLRPLETGRLRENAIQALSTSALLQAAQGNLTTALTLVDRAVKQKYDPIREQIAIATENLRLIKESPVYSLADKNRAQRQLEIQQAKADALEQQAANDKQIMSIATEAAKNGMDATTLQRIQEAGNPEEALRIATEAGAYKTIEKLDTSVMEVNGHYLLINNQTGETIKDIGTISPEWSDPYLMGGDYVQKNTKTGEIKVAVNMPAGSGGGGGGVNEQLYSGLSSTTATAVRSKVAKFSTEPMVQNFATVQDGYNFSSAIPNATTNPADDQALIYSLAKALDPNSVVREGEYATAQKYAQSWVKAYGKGVTQAILGTGFLSQEARKNIKQTIKQKYEASKKSYDNLYKEYTGGINSLTGRNDGNAFLTDYLIADATQPAQPGDTQLLPEDLTLVPEDKGGFWSNVGNWLWGD